MNDKVSKILFALSETDKSIQIQTVKKNEIEERKASLEADLAKTKERLEELDAHYKEAQSRHGLEEHRLREEESKIVERRKQLTALGGAKSAKLVERELEIASRVLESLEKTATEALEVVERIDVEMAQLRSTLEELESQYEEETKDTEKVLKEIGKELGDLGKQRDSSLKKIDDRLKNLYSKVNTRYPGNGVAVARSGACRSCFRALPAQTFNQVMAGNMLIQCPGCSRILVYQPATDE